MTGLIILNLTVATGFPWAVFPLVRWGIGLTAHYLFGLRWADKSITDRQYEDRTARHHHQPGPPDARRTAGRYRRLGRGDPWTAAGCRRATQDERRTSMPAAATSISWLGALGWLPAITAAGFLVAWVLTTWLGMRRSPASRPWPC